MFLGSRGLPREAPEAHEGSQEAPKELQNLKKQGIQKWTHKLLVFGPILGPFWDPFWGQNGLQNSSKTGSIFGLVFGPVFTDFENPVGRPAVAADVLCPRRSLGRPRAQYY